MSKPLITGCPARSLTIDKQDMEGQTNDVVFNCKLQTISIWLNYLRKVAYKGVCNKETD